MIDQQKNTPRALPLVQRFAFAGFALLLLLGSSGCAIQTKLRVANQTYHKTFYVGLRPPLPPRPVVIARVDNSARREGLSDKQTRLLEKLIVAATFQTASYALADKANDDNWVAQLALIVARKERTDAFVEVIEEIVPPGTNPLAIRMLARALGQVFDGTFSVENYTEANVRNELVRMTKEAAPEYSVGADVVNIMIQFHNMRSK